MFLVIFTGCFGLMVIAFHGLCVHFCWLTVSHRYHLRFVTDGLMSLSWCAHVLYIGLASESLESDVAMKLGLDAFLLM